MSESEHTGYVPLHEKIQDAKRNNKVLLSEVAAKDLELNLLYKTLFESEGGKKVLSHMVSIYIARFPRADAMANEIMFGYGQEFVVKEIMRRIDKGSN